MARLTQPGVTDLHWQVTAMAPDDITVSFFETEATAKTYAKSKLEPGVSVYVSEVKHQGECLRRPRSSR